MWILHVQKHYFLIHASQKVNKRAFTKPMQEKSLHCVNDLHISHNAMTIL